MADRGGFGGGFGAAPAGGGAPGGASRGRGRGRGGPRGRGGRGKREDEKTWTPVTKLGRLVKERKITKIEEIYLYSLPIKEAEIIDHLLSGLKDEVLKISPVQKQTRAGQRTRFKAFVAIGDNNGHVGLGVKCSKEVATAIRGAIVAAKLAIIPVRRGYWGSKMGEPHTVPCKVTGKCASVLVRLIPAPRGTGIVGAPITKKLLGMAGIEDCYTSAVGQTATLGNFAKAIFTALGKTYSYLTPDLWQERQLDASILQNNEALEHIIELTNQLKVTNQENGLLKNRVTEANENAIKVAAQNFQLQEDLNGATQEIYDLKTKLIEAEKSASDAAELNSKLAQSEKDKKFDGIRVSELEHKIDAIVNYNSLLCERAELSKNELDDVLKLRQKDFAEIDVLKKAAYDLVVYDHDSFLDAWELQAEEKLMVGEYQEALVEYMKILTLDEILHGRPGWHWSYWSNVSECYYRLERYEETLQVVEKEIEARNEDANQIANTLDSELNAVSFYQRGLIHEKLGNRDQSILDFKKSLEFDPTYMKAKLELEDLGEIELDGIW